MPSRVAYPRQRLGADVGAARNSVAIASADDEATPFAGANWLNGIALSARHQQGPVAVALGLAAPVNVQTAEGPLG